MSPRDLFAIQAAPEEMKNDSPATLKQLAPKVVEEKFAGTGIGRKQFVWIVEDLGLSDEEGEKRLLNHGITVSEDETMKEVKAFIKERKVDAVTLALSKIPELTGLSISPSKGFGRGRGKTKSEEMTVFDERLLDVRGVKLEIMCRDELVDIVVDTIVKHARTGLRGDGKIYISNIESAVRISTGERGDVAV